MMSFQKSSAALGFINSYAFDLLSVSAVLWEGRCAGRARNEMFHYQVVPVRCFARKSYTWQEMQSCFPAMMLININSNTCLVKLLVQSRWVLLWQSMRADRLSSLQLNGGWLFLAWWCPIKKISRATVSSESQHPWFGPSGSSADCLVGKDESSCLSPFLGHLHLQVRKKKLGTENPSLKCRFGYMFYLLFGVIFCTLQRRFWVA